MVTKTIGIVRVSRWTAAAAGVPACQDDVGLQANQLLRERSYPIDITTAPTKVNSHVAAIGPTQVRKRLSEPRHPSIKGIVFVESHEHADPTHPAALLRARRDWPCRRAAEERDELAPVQ
jgi:hypothetical protein